MTLPPLVLVVGSVNQDTTFVAERWPGPGETLAASEVYTGSGGKGANQAAAAAAAGTRTVLVAAVGDDHAGREQVAALERAGVDGHGDRDHCGPYGDGDDPGDAGRRELDPHRAPAPMLCCGRSTWPRPARITLT